MPNFRQRKWLLIVMAIAVIVILTLIAAPNSGSRKNDSGSTYGRSPDGYGAWYEYMSQQEIPIKRWRKPFSQFTQDNVTQDNGQDITYVQILSKADFLQGAISLAESELNWVSQGNTLVIIGKYEPATAAPFESLITSSIDDRQQTLADRQIKIETTRRYQPPKKTKTKIKTKSILQDRYGAVVWQEQIGQGKVVYCTTPYLAANAYQDYLDNYQFLAELVDDHETIWVDEYIHGYKDKETTAQEQQENILSYLVKTPLYLLFIQTALMAIIAAVAAFRRFGLPVKPKVAIADNSIAYIDALAGVLEKAQTTDFVVEAIVKDEQRKLQSSLGLGKSLVDQASLIAAWKLQKGAESDLSQLFKVSNAGKKISDAQLIDWMQKWQKINEE
jgi:Domain of unknown function (DUF4350)